MRYNVGDFDEGPGTIGYLVDQLGAPIEQVLTVLFHMVRADPTLDRWAIVNPGCSAEEIAEAERRIGRPLHPLHRHLLRLSNGGTLPMTNETLALRAAVPRERDWRIIRAFVSPAEHISLLC